MSEFKAMESVDKALAQIEDQGTRDRILRWALDKFGSKEISKPLEEKAVESRTQKAKANKASGSKRAKGSGNATKLSIDKDLNLRPRGKQPFSEFIAEKAPSNNDTRNLAAVYYLTNVLEVQASTNRVYTCYKDAGWRVPPNMGNSMQITASKKGWLDTSNMAAIRVTTSGDNYVEHDMPVKKKGKR